MKFIESTNSDMVNLDHVVKFYFRKIQDETHEHDCYQFVAELSNGKNSILMDSSEIHFFESRFDSDCVPFYLIEFIEFFNSAELLYIGIDLITEVFTEASLEYFGDIEINGKKITQQEYKEMK